MQLIPLSLISMLLIPPGVSLHADAFASFAVFKIQQRMQCGSYLKDLNVARAKVHLMKLKSIIGINLQVCQTESTVRAFKSKILDYIQSCNLL